MSFLFYFSFLMYKMDLLKNNCFYGDVIYFLFVNCYSLDRVLNSNSISV